MISNDAVDVPCILGPEKKGFKKGVKYSLETQYNYLTL